MKRVSLTIKIGLIVLCSFLVILSFEAFQGFNRYKIASIKEKLINNKYVDDIKTSIYDAALNHEDVNISQLENDIINDESDKQYFYSFYKTYEDKKELETIRNLAKEQYILIADKDGKLINAGSSDDLSFYNNDCIQLSSNQDIIIFNVTPDKLFKFIEIIDKNWHSGINIEVSTTNSKIIDKKRYIENPDYLKIGNIVLLNKTNDNIEKVCINNINCSSYHVEENEDMPLDKYYLLTYPFFQNKIKAKVHNTYEEGYFEQDNITVVYSYAAIEDNNYQPFGYILKVGLYPDLNESIFLEYLNDNIYSYLLSVLFVILISFIASKMITKPIKLIEQRTKEITNGDFTKQLPVKSNDELGSLIKNINIMNDTIKANIDNLNENIDKIKKLENTRKDFIANFTHEIKTPLAIINGYSELIEDSDDNVKKEQYLSIINEQTEKINNLVLAMLELSKLESNHVELDLEEINLGELVTPIIDNLTYLLKIKKIKIELYNDNSIIIGDKFKIEMVVNNYLTNAIKHTYHSGIIKVIIRDKALIIENTGPHINNEKLKNIWLSFIKDDQDGTGLGLAICKAILDLHHFKYGAMNIESGVRFYFKA